MNQQNPLELQVLQLQAQLAEQRAALHRIYQSKTWRWTQPFRTLDGLIHNRLLQRTKLDLIPLNQVTKGSSRFAWEAHGDDPQFLLSPRNPAVMRHQGWALLQVDIRGANLGMVEVFLDLGFGFHSDLAYRFDVRSNHPSEVPLYLPRSLRALRIDPLHAPGAIEIRSVSIKRLREAPVDLGEAAPLVDYLQNLDQRSCRLRPLHEVSRTLTGRYHWTSHGQDPHFLLEFAHGPHLEPGWYTVRLQQQQKRPRSKAKLYFDFGDGFTEVHAVVLPHTSGEPLDCVFHLPQLAHKVRFDPKEVSGEFRVDEIAIHPLDESKARDAMLATEPTLGKDPALSTTDLYRAYQQNIERRHDHLPYQEWIETVEQADQPSAEAVTALSERPDAPKISIVMPAYNTPEPLLRACIDSVRRQSYPHWELCITDDASPAPHVWRVLQEYAQRDQRIRVTRRQQNGHISRASNDALALATGDFVALLDHDDELPSNALYFVAEQILCNSGVQIIYSDEDKITVDGERFEPHFKSDWNPDLFYSQNYVSHLGVYARPLLNKIGGFRPGVEGSQDQDLLLRCLPHVKANQIVHIPRVLYHWRTVEGSTALGSGEKSYTTLAGIKALQDHFKEHGPEGITVEAGQVANTYRVRWPIPSPEPLVSLLIPTRDKKDITEVAVRSILDKTTYSNYEILILDNGSVERETLDFFEQIQRESTRVRVLRYDHPFNYSAINNFGVKHAAGEIVGLINNDVEVISPEWLTEMVSHAVRPDIGCVGAKLYYGNNTIQHAGVILGIGGVAGHSHKQAERDALGYFSRLKIHQNLSAVTAACLLVKKSVYEQVGGLDENNLRVAFNDVDFCLKVRENGYRNLWTPYAELYHHESISRGQEDTPEKISRFQKEIDFMKSKWGEKIKLDPNYNPNLTLASEDFSINRMPEN